MATTTAAITLTSADLLTDALSLSATNTLYKAGTTVGLDQTTGMTKAYLTATTNIDIFPTLIEGSMAFAGKSSWVYICNKSVDETEYITVKIEHFQLETFFEKSDGDFRENIRCAHYVQRVSEGVGATQLRYRFVWVRARVVRGRGTRAVQNGHRASGYYRAERPGRGGHGRRNRDATRRRAGCSAARQLRVAHRGRALRRPSGLSGRWSVHRHGRWAPLHEDLPGRMPRALGVHRGRYEVPLSCLPPIERLESCLELANPL